MYNEKLREKDVEIAAITSERNLLQTRVTFLESLPSRVSDIATTMISMFEQGKTNLESLYSLSQRLGSLTNDLANFKSDAHFVLRVNGLVVTNLMAIPSSDDGVLGITLENIGADSGVNTIVNFGISTAATNVTSQGWDNLPPGGTLLGVPTIGYLWNATLPIKSFVPDMLEEYHLPSITLATNSLAKPILCHFQVYGDNSRVQNFIVLICLREQCAEASRELQAIMAARKSKQ
jgi:hypothetical protein